MRAYMSTAHTHIFTINNHVLIFDNCALKKSSKKIMILQKMILAILLVISSLVAYNITGND